MVAKEIELDRDVVRFRSLTFASSTKQSYASHRRAYLKFCLEMGYHPVPISTLNICRYAAFLSKRLAFSSIKKYLNIIRILHLEAGFPNPMKENWFLDTVLKGVARDKGKVVHRKLPITPAILLAIKSRLNPTSVEDLVFWAAALVAFFGFLRKANLFPSSTHKFDPSKHLSRLDFSLYHWGILLHIRWSKTIQYGERVLSTPLPRLQGHPLCPVDAVLRALIATRGAPPGGPAFMIPRAGGFIPLSPAKFISLLKSHLSALGFSPVNFSGHSFRRGAATWALTRGLPGEVIKILGDWKSDAYLAYLSLDQKEKVNSIFMFATGLPTH